jgi:hypothetical protein
MLNTVAYQHSEIVRNGRAIDGIPDLKDRGPPLSEAAPGTGRISPLANSKPATNATTPPSRMMLGGAVQDRTLQSPGT